MLLLNRFGREPDGGRVGYISAKTMLGVHDGDERDDDITQLQPEAGSAVKADLAELFARVVFNVAVHDTDAHLGNHGFVRQRGGWSLPLFDVNLNPDLGRRRVTGVREAAGADDEVAALVDFAGGLGEPRPGLIWSPRHIGGRVGETSMWTYAVYGLGVDEAAGSWRVELRAAQGGFRVSGCFPGSALSTSSCRATA